MALISCPECSKEVSDAALSCPGCAYPIASAEGKKESQQATDDKKGMGVVPKILLIIGGLFAAFMALGLYKSNTPEGQAKARARDAIRLCWAEQGRKSFSSDTQRFVAGACESMEEDFKRKYGVNP